MPVFISLERAVQLTSGCVQRLDPEKADGAARQDKHYYL